MKKLVFAVIVLVLAAGGFFYWWQTQADIRTLNKTLPDGVKVVKSLLGNEYEVVNNIDEYSFKIPPEWKGVKEIEYISERNVENYTASSIGLEGIDNFATPLSIDIYEIQAGTDLMSWAQQLWSSFNLAGELEQDFIQDVSVVKVFEDKYLGKTYVYFLKNDTNIYVFNNASEDFIRYIIANGRW